MGGFQVKFDFHTHHERCGHATGTIKEYIDSAVSKGLNMIGISDHSPYFGDDLDHPNPGVAMAKSEFEVYVNEMIHLKEMYKDKIEVLIGVESDFFPNHAQLYQQIYQKYPFDYIIGSIHQLNGSSIFNRDRWATMSEEELLKNKEDYYSLIQQSARSGMFDILGHIDAIKKDCPQFTTLETESVEKTIKVIAESDVAIEVNTSGTLFSCNEWFPSEEVLQLARHYGVKVTFGSDAHNIERVGDGFEAVQKKLREIGFTEWVIFRNRKRESIAL